VKDVFAAIRPSADERSAERPGDDIVPAPDAVMDRAFTIDARPEQIWPWLVQLGKHRAGWYLPRSLERFLLPNRRAARTLDPRWQRLRVGDVIPDYGGRHETFEVAAIEPVRALVYRSTRGRMEVSWSLTLTPADRGTAAAATSRATRVHLRLRLGPIRRRWLLKTAGELFDVLTVAGVAAGLRERVTDAVSGDRT
jgi:hypothetical protein